MTSLRSLWSYIGLLTVCLFHLSSAVVIRGNPNTTAPLPASPSSTTPANPSFALPTNPNGALPAPDPSFSIKFVTIGHGTQNYTCAGANSQPVPIGALATLFDASSIAAPDLNEAVKCALNNPNSMSDKKILGSHFFNAAGAPIFNLDTVGDILIGKKIASVKAPSDADPGPNGTGAVAWLALVDAGGSVGVKEVYRVETAGGNPPATCASAGLVTEPYAAAYLMFG